MRATWRLDLHPEGVGECLDGEFGDMVPSPEIEHDLAGDGRDVDDGSAPLLPHVRQDELRQPGQAEDINLQLPAGFFDGHVLDGAEGAVTGIVDQDVDPALRLQDGGDTGLHRSLVRHIQRQRHDAEFAQRLHPIHPAGGADNYIGILRHLQGLMMAVGVGEGEESFTINPEIHYFEKIYVFSRGQQL